MRSVKLSFLFLFAILLLCGAAFAQGVAGDPETGDFQLTGGGAGTWSIPGGGTPQVTSRVAAFSGGNCVLTSGGTGFPASVTSGDYIFVAVLDSQNNTNTLSVSDSLGSTFTQAFLGNSASTPTLAGFVFKGWTAKLASSGADTITLTTTGTGLTQCQALQLRWSAGGVLATPLDGTGVIQQFTTTPSVTTSANLTANGEAVIACFGNSSGSGFAGAGASFTLGSGDTGGFCEYQFLASGSGSGATQTATAATTGGFQTAEGIATIKHP